ncbi:hypothetical protein AYO20_05815 [Fonsecaea nubica]|uniref:Thioredoxin domain-containing protein n=1 Tax=Fonsecaea nubica TaxID=856822 RepID=A0A178D149_9EURO|nr:hypothetical protein AYO20_05815 [Fonsecaea nubica]OAL34855.1 hypothetical protein AYO20_05815 [Fonsecaea nubica]
MKAQMLLRTWVIIFALIQVHGCKAALEYTAPATLKALVSTSPSKDNLVIAVFFGTLKSLDVPLLLFVVSEDEAPELSTVRGQVAEKLQDKFLVVTTTNLTLAEEADIPPPFVVVWNSLDEVKPIYRDDFEMGPILKFAEQTSTPVIGRLDLKSYIDHTQSGLPIAFILAETDRERKTIAESLKHVALKYKGKINFVTLDTTNLPFLLEPLGVDATRLPALALHRGDDDEVFVYDQNRQINRRDVETFIQRAIHRPVTEL